MFIQDIDFYPSRIPGPKRHRIPNPDPQHLQKTKVVSELKRQKRQQSLGLEKRRKKGKNIINDVCLSFQLLFFYVNTPGSHEGEAENGGVVHEGAVRVKSTLQPKTTLIKKKIKFSSYIRKFRVEQLQSHI
jgi:hypothetical protein